MTRNVRLIAGVLAIAIVAGGFGESAQTAGAGSGDPSKRATLKVVSSKYGKLVADRRGEALYLFTADGKGRSKCYGDCAKAWPPFLTKGQPRAGKGIKASALGTRKRRDGKLQVTYKGQPLYYFVGDGPGLILCQNVFEYGGIWRILAPNGTAVTVS